MGNNETQKMKMTKQEKAWVLYDVGNSAYTMLACSLIPIWFKALAIGEGPGKITGDQATAYWALATSIITVIVALIGPFVGVLTDKKDRKKFYFTSTVAIGAIGCILNGLATGWLLFLLIYVITKVSYSTSQVIYDSMLGDVTTEERMDEVSSYGYAWGYLGSCAPFLVALIAYVAGPDMLKILPDVVSKLIGCVVTAGWWFGVTMPLIREYKQVYFSEGNTGAAGRIFLQICSTVKRIAIEDKKILWFLVAFFLYIDGVGTIIDNCINVGTDMGLDTVGQVVALLATQVVAFAFSIFFARLSRNMRTVTIIRICIIGYFCVCLYALTLHSLLGFAVLAFFVGAFQGSIQSMSRSYFTKIIPSENSGEYFGIYDIFSKGASFLGSAVLAGVKLAGGTSNVAVACLAIFFFLGLIFLNIADKTPARA